MSFVSHPLIKPNTIESRLYQEAIFDTIRNKNSLVVLPTGIGKTIVCILLAVERLEKNPSGKIIMAAPTRPLCAQHKKTFENILNREPDDFVLVTGVIPPEDRRQLYKKQLIFITPQTLRNDVKSGIFDMRDVVLLCLDECHRAVGNYAYPFIAESYMKNAANPRILGLTASPGGSSDKIREICRNLFIDAVEIRSELDSDVEPYIKKTDVEWVNVEFPEEFKEIKAHLEAAFQKRIAILRRRGLQSYKFITKKVLLMLQSSLQKRIAKGDKTQFYAISILAEAIKIEHALELLETQGINALEKYLSRLEEQASAKQSRAVKRVVSDDEIKTTVSLIKTLSEKNIEHPKFEKLLEIIRTELKSKPDIKIIVFSHYRDTTDLILNKLKEIEGCNPVKIIGQREGLSQKEQISILKDYEDGFYNCLIGTSISEEGLHLASADLAIFFEPIPSEIRQLQRRGRVGRTKAGKVIILVTKGTRDEKYLWSAFHKERKMKKILTSMKEKGIQREKNLSEYVKSAQFEA